MKAVELAEHCFCALSGWTFSTAFLYALRISAVVALLLTPRTCTTKAMHNPRGVG